MSKTIAIGIDIGTYQVKIVVSECLSGNERSAPKIIGTGFAESKGLRHGYIINAHEVTRSILAAKRQAEKAAGVEIKKAYLSIGGISLMGSVHQSSIVVSRADSEVSDYEVQKVLEQCENELPQSFSMNRKIIHAVPIAYKIDGRQVLGRPQGMKGMKLEVKTLFITCLEQHLNDLVHAVGEAGIEVEDVMASPLAASLVTLTKAQKIAGCVLTNIGAETVSIVVFENNIPISLEVFPIGSIDITHDIALGLKIPLEEAEKLKLGHSTEHSFSKKRLDDIIGARLTDIFELIDAHLKKIGRNELLPAGIIITGGGSGVTSIEDIAKAALRLPSKIGSIAFETHSRINLKDSSWAVAYGLCILGFTQEKEPSLGVKMVSETKNRIVEWVKRFLP
jgi:cell division protein FtsA